MSSPSSIEEPQFISIRKLLAEVREGLLSVPRFLRPFLWSDEQRLDLVRSIKEKMPIGSLIVWRTSHRRLPCIDHLGPYKVPTHPNDYFLPQSYLLDGHQRLATLYGLFNLPQSEAVDPTDRDEDARKNNWNIQYNLREEDFVFVRGKMALTEPLVPLPHLIDSRGARQTQRALDQHAKARGWSDDDVESWSAHLDELCFRFAEYRVLMIPVVTDDIALAMRTFHRINRSGTAVDEAQVVSSMTWSDHFDLREQMNELRLGLPASWRGINEHIILNTLKGLVRLDITKPGGDRLVRAVNTGLLHEAQTALTRAITFFTEERLVPHESLLPYGLQLVLLALALRDAVPTDPDERARVAAWFQLTTLWESYSGAKSSTIGEATRHVSAFVQGESRGHGVTPLGGISGLTRRYDLKSARSCGVLNALAKRPGLMDAHGQPIDAFDLLAREGKDAILRLVPSAGLDERARTLQQSVANIFIVPAEQHKEFRKRLYDGPDLREDTLRAHHLTSAGVMALRAGRPEALLKARLEELEGLERARYVDVHTLLLGAKPQVTDEPEE